MGWNPKFVCLFFLGRNCCALDILAFFLSSVCCLFSINYISSLSVCWVFSVVPSLKILQTFWGNMGNFRLLMIWIKHIQEIYNFKEFADILFSFPPYLPPLHPKFEKQGKVLILPMRKMPNQRDPDLHRDWVLCSAICCGHSTTLPLLGVFLPILVMRVWKFIPLFCRPWLLPMVWFGGNLEDDVTSAVQCSGRLTRNLLSCCENNIDVKCQYKDSSK